MGMARGTLALIGGPAGAAMLAGAAIFYFYQKAQQARQESIEFADSLDGVLAKMKDMNSAQLAANIAKAEQSIIDQREAIADLTQEYDELSQRKTFIEQASQIRGAAAVAEDYAEINRDLAIQAGKVDSAENKLSQTVSSVGILRAQLNGTLLQGIDLLRRDGEAAGVTAGIMNSLIQMPDIYDSNQQQGYITGRAGNNFDTSEPITFTGSMYVLVTDSLGNPTLRIRRRPAAKRSTDSPPQYPTFSSISGTEIQCSSHRDISSQQLRKWTASFGLSTALNQTTITQYL